MQRRKVRNNKVFSVLRSRFFFWSASAPGFWKPWGSVRLLIQNDKMSKLEKSAPAAAALDQISLLRLPQL